jgi:hypothetical protein
MIKPKRIVLTFRDGEILVRTLYQASLDGPNPDTKRRLKEVRDLTCRGLEEALGALEASASEATCVGSSGFTTREDILSLDTSEAGGAA